MERVEHALGKISSGLEQRPPCSHGTGSQRLSHVPTSASTLSGASQPAHVASLSEVYFAGCYLGDFNMRDGMPIFSGAGKEWIRSMTGEEPVFQHIETFGRPWQAQQAAPNQPSKLLGLIQAHPNDSLPDKALVEQILSFYLDGYVYMAFPLIDPELFRHTLAAAYSNHGTTYPCTDLDHIIAKASVLAFLAFISLWHTEGNTIPPIDGSRFAAKACSHLPQLFLHTSLTTAQTTVMLVSMSICRRRGPFFISPLTRDPLRLYTSCY